MNHAIEPNLWLQSYNAENSVGLFGKEFENVWKEPNSDACRKWLRQIETWMREWNFDAFGMHFQALEHHLISPDLYHTDQIRMMKYHTAMQPGDEWPDVFSQKFSVLVDRTAKLVCERSCDKGNLLGYYFTDEAAWMGFFRRIPDEFNWWFHFNPWTDYLRRLPANAPGKQAWVSVLKENHPSPHVAATAYGVNVTSWGEIEALTDWPSPQKNAVTGKDNISMLTRIAEKWYSIQHEAIRGYDPNHLIFGDKHYNRVPDWLYPILKKYVDVIVIQRGGWNPGFEEDFREIHRETDKPILIGDGVPNYGPAQETVEEEVTFHRYDEEKMGESYTQFASALAAEPYIVGYHHCGFIQTWQTPERKGYAIRSGFVNPFGEPYKKFVDHVARTNRQINEWHWKARPA